MIWWTIAIAAFRGTLLALWLFFKPVLGWFFIVLGLIGMPMPIVNGLIFLMIGLALVGPRNRAVRWSRVRIKTFLRRWAALPTPLIGALGRLADRSARNVSRASRRLHWWSLERRAARRMQPNNQTPELP
ncbi:MAG: hypothetical protein HC822_09435 [Oscillochloris sp.]|nr:hypothetical protein [Oscillochloris sp.]